MKENNITINFTSIIDYIKDKDIEIENWRYKHLKLFREQKHLQEKITKALSILKTEDGTIPDYQIIEDTIEILEEV